MKRWIAWLLAAALLFSSLPACSKSAAATRAACSPKPPFASMAAE